MSTQHPARAVGVAVGCLWLAAGGPAPAFFPPVPVGSDPVVVIPPPQAPVLPVAPQGDPTPVPLVPAPPFTPPPTRVVVPQEVPHCPPVTPQVVPEPASVVSVVAGLAALGAARCRRRAR